MYVKVAEEETVHVSKILGKTWTFDVFVKCRKELTFYLLCLTGNVNVLYELFLVCLVK